MRILLVDDSPSTRLVLRDMLESMGYNDFVEVADGIDAARAMEQESIDLVVSDWRMPNMDGITLLKTLRANGNDVPVLIVITKAERCHAIAALQAGASSYIIKPFDSTTLAERIRQALANATPPTT